MVPLWAEVALLAASLVVLLYQGFALLLAAQMPRLDPAAPGPVGSCRPRVSVVIAARNEELVLPATLDGLVAQDYANLEIIVVEDGSTDRTGEVIDARALRSAGPSASPPVPDGGGP